MADTTNLKDGIKPTGKVSEQGNINLLPKPNERKTERKAQVKPETKPETKPQAKPSGPKPATKIDIDGTLVGKRVTLYVQVGNTAGTIIGTIITMGSFWVVVRVEKSQLPFIHDVAFINKAYIIVYAPLPEGEQK